MSSGYTEINYLVATNEDWRDGLEIATGEAEERTPVSLIGSSFIAHIRRADDALNAVMVASTDNGRLVIAEEMGTGGDPESVGVLLWNISDDEVRQHFEPGEYVYDILWFEPGGGVDMIVAGKIEVVRGITRPVEGISWQ